MERLEEKKKQSDHMNINAYATRKEKGEGKEENENGQVGRQQDEETC